MSNRFAGGGPLGGLLARFRFGIKLWFLPIITLVAFSIVIGAGLHYSRENKANLESIRDAYIPTLQTSRDLQDTLAVIQRGLQDAAAAENAELLAESDAQRAAFLTKMDELAELGLRTPTALGALRNQFDQYYSHARDTTRGFIEHGASPELVQSLSTMTTRYNGVRDALGRATDRDEQRMQQAFELALSANASSATITLTVAFVSALLLALLAWGIYQATMSQLREVADGFTRVGAGDFAVKVPVRTADEMGDLAAQVNATTDILKGLVAKIRETSTQVNSAAAEMAATANQHEAGASEQSSAVEETQRTMESILASSDQMNSVLDVVLKNAEQTQAKNQLIAESIVALSSQTDGITEILATIKDIANKAELLALNAALEGTKAGEVGRGFSLVATQMQRLAENVMRAVADIKELTDSIRIATGASVLATEEGAKLATDTTRSTREIRLMLQQHQTGNRQVSVAMEDVARVARHSAAGSRQLLTSSRELAELSQQLIETTERFRLEAEAGDEG